jgi:site-specific DNA recombinase
MPTVYLYSRTSTIKQESSLEQQMAVLVPFCQSKGFTEYVSLVDGDTSAGKPILQRPSGSKLAALQKGDSIICCKIDRMTRDIVNGSAMLKRWTKLGVNIYFLNISQEPIDMNNSNTKFQVHVLILAAELEKDNTSERTKTNLTHRKKTGKIHASANYGWDNIGQRDNKNKLINGEKVRNEKEQSVISDIKEYRRLNYSLNWIANKLNLDKIPSKKGGKWHAKTVQDVLDNSLNNIESV